MTKTNMTHLGRNAALVIGSKTKYDSAAEISIRSVQHVPEAYVC